MARRAADRGLRAACLGLLLLAAAPARSQEPFDGERAFALLEELCAFGPRVPGGEAHRLAGDWLLERLRRDCDEAIEERFVHAPSAGHPLAAAHPDGIAMRNLVGRVGPGAQRRVLLAAHWDSRPFSDQESDSARAALPVLGANDAASGVAVLLLLAERFAAAPPAVGVDFVLFDGEDFGQQGNLDEYFLGSREHARRLGWPRPEAGILLDMVGDRDLRLPIEAYSWRHAPDLVRAIWNTARELGLDGIFAPVVGPAVMDDHLPLLEAGVPCIDIIDFDYPEWHTNGDTPDACSPESLQAVGRVLEEVLRSGGIP